jgi:S-adenosyl-methyltransferase MraW
MSEYHTPVMLNESISGLNIKKDGIYIDATFGGGGHSMEILNRLGPKGKLIAFDKDSDAIANIAEDKRLLLIHNNFRFIQNFVSFYGIKEVDGILADLGVSSHQFDTSERGFSFRFDTPLDMRMNKLASKSAEEIINKYSLEELERILKLYGEVEQAKRASQLICAARDRAHITTTGELNNAVSKLYTKETEHKFLAKLYQALRIEVNMEMLALEDFLNGSKNILRIGGRLCVITYHSLEDRMVKKFY